MEKNQTNNNIIHLILVYLIKPFKNEAFMLIIIMVLLSWYIFSMIIWSEILSKLIDYITKIFFILWLISSYDLIKELKLWNDNMKENLKKMEEKVLVYENNNIELMLSLKSYIDTIIEKDNIIIDYIEKNKKGV